MLEIIIQLDVIKSIAQNAWASVNVQNNLMMQISPFPALSFKFSRSVNLEKQKQAVCRL